MHKPSDRQSPITSPELRPARTFLHVFVELWILANIVTFFAIRVVGSNLYQRLIQRASH